MSNEEKDKRIYSAETLPEGWKWHIFTNQRGYLKDPEGKTLYEIDTEIDTSYVSFTSHEGYLYGADSFIEAQREIEKLTNELLQKEQEEKINQEDAEKIYPAKKLPEGWNWHIYDDGIGHLESPEGNHYCGFEIQWHGMEYKDFHTNNWNWTNQNFDVFQLLVEKEVEETLVKKQPVEESYDKFYTLGELKRYVDQSEDGLFEIPETRMTVADQRYFDQLEMSEEIQILCVFFLETECDYFILTDNDTVIWRDNWSGEEDRIYKGEVFEQIKFQFFEESFETMTNELTLQTESLKYNDEEECEFEI